jgi:alkaline phosphatase D
MQRYSYYRRQSRPAFRQLTAGRPVYAIWDDHDFSTNDSRGGPKGKTPYWKRWVVWPTFQQNWINPGHGGGNDRPGCYYTYKIGDVQFIMLDCRYYRQDPSEKQAGDRDRQAGGVVQVYRGPKRWISAAKR